MTDGFYLNIGELTFDLPTTILSDGAVEGGASLSLWGDATLFGEANGFYNNFGNGVADPPVEIAQLDLEFRFTGVAAGGDPSDNDAPIVSGGQWTTQWDRASFGEADLTSLANVNLRAPFELWVVDDLDPDNHYQIQFAIINRNADDSSPYGNDIGDPNTPGMEPRYRMSGRDYIVPIYKTYDPATAETETYAHNDPATAWLLFYEQGGESVWANGDIYGVEFGNPIQAGVDEYSFSVTGATRNNVDLAKDEVEKVNVFPNPYYAFNPEETSRFDRFVTFTHLPQQATIRIFTLSGVLVRKIEHNSESQFEQWDLRNEADLPVASGIYITHIDMPDPINKEKVLKVFVVQGDQILEFY